jgi:hypothetical protein
MTEKLKILKHHVEMIHRNDLATQPAAVRWNKIRAYESKRPSYVYNFTSEIMREKHTRAINKASVAILKNNFEEIPDFQIQEEKQNYDLLCFTCPNYEHGEDLCNLYLSLWLGANR